MEHRQRFYDPNNEALDHELPNDGGTPADRRETSRRPFAIARHFTEVDDQRGGTSCAAEPAPSTLCSIASARGCSTSRRESCPL